MPPPFGKRKVRLMLRFAAAPQIVLRLGVAVEKRVQPLAKLLLNLGVRRLVDQVCRSRPGRSPGRTVRCGSSRNRSMYFHSAVRMAPDVLELVEDDIVPLGRASRRAARASSRGPATRGFGGILSFRPR